MTLLPDLQANCENVWAKVQISASKSLTLECFYRPPPDTKKSLNLMSKNSNQAIVLGGDFNLHSTDWDDGVENPEAASKSQCELLLSSLDTQVLSQIHQEPTREKNILDLLITNRPGLIKCPPSVPGISDHCAVGTELDIDPPYRQYRGTKPRPVRQFKVHIGKLSGKKLGAAGPPLKKSPNRSVNEN